MFCKAPWNSLVVHMDGTLLPDPVYKNSNPVKDIDEYWNNSKELRDTLIKNNFHQNCISCKTKEEKIGWSRRKYLNQTFKNIDFKDTFDIKMLEVDMSNNCNLKCVMCSGSYSTSWIKDEKHFKDIGWVDYRGLPRDYEDKGSVFLRNANNLESVKKIVDRCPNIEFIAIKGGEPFVEPANLDLLDYIIKNINSYQLTLDIHTNGSKYDERFIQRFDKFKKVNITVSLEALDEDLYSYIRGGDKTSIFEVCNNIKKFKSIPNVYLSISTLWMVYNIFEPVKIYKHFVEQQGIDTYFKNVVAFPKYLSYNVLPKKYLIEAHDNIINNIIDNKTSQKSGILKLAKSFLNSKRDIQSFYDFISYNFQIDQIRYPYPSFHSGSGKLNIPWFKELDECYHAISFSSPQSTENISKYQEEIYEDPQTSTLNYLNPKIKHDVNIDLNFFLPYINWSSNKKSGFFPYDPNFKILDIGCGYGIYTNILHKKHGFNITGIDLSNNAINFAKKNFKEQKFINGDVFKYFPEKKYDACIDMSATFLSCENIELNEILLESVKRLMKNIIVPGGTYTHYVPKFKSKFSDIKLKKMFSHIGEILYYNTCSQSNRIVVIMKVNNE